MYSVLMWVISANELDSWACWVLFMSRWALITHSNTLHLSLNVVIISIIIWCFYYLNDVKNFIAFL